MRILIKDEIIDFGTKEQIQNTLDEYIKYNNYEAKINTKRDNTIQRILEVFLLFGTILFIYLFLYVWNSNVLISMVKYVFVFLGTAFLSLLICDWIYNYKKIKEKEKYLSNEELNGSLFSYLLTLEDEQFAKMINFLLYIKDQDTDEIRVVVNDKHENIEIV